MASGSGDTKALQEKIVKLRKRNADLMNLTKKLDERCTALKMDNEQLVRNYTWKLTGAHLICSKCELDLVYK